LYRKWLPNQPVALAKTHGEKTSEGVSSAFYESGGRRIRAVFTFHAVAFKRIRSEDRTETASAASLLRIFAMRLQRSSARS
jgi:hypothetical protein